MKYTRIPVDTFKKLQLNAGMILRDFDPSTGEAEEKDLMGATTGGNNFTAKPTFSDWGEDIDNCPNGMMELKKLDDVEVKITGNFVTVDTQSGRDLVGAADIDPEDPTHVIPRRDLTKEDFKDLWWVGDYSDENGDKNGGYIAIHMMNTLSTGGFSIQSKKNGKGQLAFEFQAHFSMENQETVPYELFIKGGKAAEPVRSQTQESEPVTEAAAE